MYRKPIISLEDFPRLRMQVGQLTTVDLLKKARKPSYVMTLDLGEQICTTCGQFVKNYSPAELQGKQVTAITNFEPRRIAGVKSQALTLGFYADPKDTQAVAISPYDPVPNGSYINFSGPDFVNPIDFEHFLALDIRAGTIKEIREINGQFLAFVNLGTLGQRIAWIPGQLKEPQRFVEKNIQVPVWLNMPLVHLNSSHSFDSILLAVPCEQGTHEDALPAYHYEHLTKVNRLTTLLTSDKSVENGMSLC